MRDDNVQSISCAALENDYQPLFPTVAFETIQGAGEKRRHRGGSHHGQHAIFHENSASNGHTYLF